MAAQPGEYSSLVRRGVRGHGWEVEGLGGLTASALCLSYLIPLSSRAHRTWLSHLVDVSGSAVNVLEATALQTMACPDPGVPSDTG